ncbi:helix-turn-helix transcriptional regulator [Paenibacillus sp. UMB7766-LJ446]|uniref:DNA-binding XRE family transcriptional regulator n=2 Tax=Paenibacillus TaxID=44249 RepID=A0A855XK87_9BACL|nr:MULTISPECIES: helix-turn-helix transcriptional regulator [Paenibacillus]MDK8192223.1 helix-turn-helix transcriptional regulator [Paenibacillus sp. UMB7766-LJ446]PWW32928.1 DNA-binding XRE family transcriptional regulator [Paenibacillus pabuli]PXV98811.1 DNA-binding XRE family transcriptional regulator [Paenibacillus taichungensis]
MIGDILKKTRSIYGYKAKDMSVKLDISPSYLSEIENNKKKPSLDILEKYAKIFDMKVSTLILLSEDHDDALKTNKPQEFIKRMMVKLIDVMSKDEVKSNGENSTKV